MFFPALAADAEANAMRTRALGAIGLGSSFAVAGKGAGLVSLFFFARDLEAVGFTVFLVVGDGGVEVDAADGGEILEKGLLLLPDVDLAMLNHKLFTWVGKVPALLRGWR
jgi:hypothetical protein